MGTRASSRQRYDAYRSRRRKAGTDRLDDIHSDKQVDSKSRRSRSAMTLLREFLRLLSDHWKVVAAALGTLTIASGLNLLLPMSTKVAIDYIWTDNPGPAYLSETYGLPSNPMTILWMLGGGLVVVTIVSISVGLWGRWQVTRIGKLIQIHLRRRVFDHAAHLPLGRIYQIKSGGVSSILREDAGAAADLVFSMIYNPWRAIVQLAGTMVILAWVDWRMLVGALLLLPTIYFTHGTWIKRIRPVWRDIRMTRTTIDAHATEAFGGMRVVRGFARESGETMRFIKGNGLMVRQELLAWWWSRLLEITWSVMIPLASVAVLLYGGSQIIKGSLTVGDVMMFSAYLLMLLGPLEMLTNSATGIQNSLSGFDRILDLLAEPREFANTTPTQRVHRREVAGRLEMDDVSFAYDGANRPVLEEISIDVRPGETIALVGPSGSGKTTFCNLVARFYDPTAGVIRLDGVPLTDIEVPSYRGLLGIVEQDVFLFDGTIFENIAYARRDATPEMVEAAAAAANADEFIRRLDSEYDTLIGERGVRLSGGQKQRVAIARAVLADPAILILDEATSNLDSESELLIKRSLDTLMQGRTSFVIAHRLSTIRHADRIVVLEEGRIVEIGSHEELIEGDGRYAEFLRLQVEGDAELEDPAVTAGGT